jgi:predicted ATPase
MRLRSLELPEFKNLRSFRLPSSSARSIGSESELGDAEPILMLLGKNGSGKSNLLEALLTICRDLDLGVRSWFPYDLRYDCGGHHVHVDALGDQAIVVAHPLTGTDKRARTYSPAQFARSGRSLRPSHVFGYYSGQSQRFSSLFDEHETRFRRALLARKRPPLRPMFLARPEHSMFVLLAFFSDRLRYGSNPRLQLLRDELNITSLDSVLFALHTPEWERSPARMTEADRHDRDWRFWGARGTVSAFLGALYDVALAPLRQPAPRGHGRRELLFLYLRNEDALQLLRERTGASNAGEFFAMLESLALSDLIHEIRVRVNVRGADGPLTFRELSEGEQQLLTVLGLIEFTREDEALFLLDEPDTHLNPAWGMRYTELLSRQIGDLESCQFIVATHDPVAVANLPREAVIVLEREDSAPARLPQISAHHPDVSPRGLGVAGILTSEMFGLKTTIDRTTMGQINRRLELFELGDARSDTEQREFERLSADLSELGFNYELSDPYQEAFAAALSRRFRNMAEVLSDTERAELESEADRLITELLNDTEH